MRRLSCACVHPSRMHVGRDGEQCGRSGDGVVEFFHAPRGADGRNAGLWFAEFANDRRRSPAARDLKQMALWRRNREDTYWSRKNSAGSLTSTTLSGSSVISKLQLEIARKPQDATAQGRYRSTGDPVNHPLVHRCGQRTKAPDAALHVDLCRRGVAYAPNRFLRGLQVQPAPVTPGLRRRHPGN
jgi:hypothetical protein